MVNGRGLTDPALAVDERDDPAHGHLLRKACAAPPGARTFRRGTGPASRHGRSDAEQGPRALYRRVPPRNISATFHGGTRPPALRGGTFRGGTGSGNRWRIRSAAEYATTARLADHVLGQRLCGYVAIHVVPIAIPGRCVLRRPSRCLRLGGVGAVSFWRYLPSVSRTASNR